MPRAAAPPSPPPLDELPGHYIRRLQQIAVAIFLEETEDHGITPVQFAALAEVARQPQIDQRTLARMLAPLPPAERGLFMRMLRQLVEANNALSRAPSEP